MLKKKKRRKILKSKKKIKNLKSSTRKNAKIDTISTIPTQLTSEELTSFKKAVIPDTPPASVSSPTLDYLKAALKQAQSAGSFVGAVYITPNGGQKRLSVIQAISDLQQVINELEAGTIKVDLMLQPTQIEMLEIIAALQKKTNMQSLETPKWTFYQKLKNLFT